MANEQIMADLQKAIETWDFKLADSATKAAIEAKMASDEVQALIAQNVEAQMASEEIQSAIADNTEAQAQKAIADTMAGSEVQGKLAAAAEGAKSVIALKTSLDQYNAFYLGIQSYTAGVDAAANGAKDLSSGVAQLRTGAASLALLPFVPRFPAAEWRRHALPYAALWFLAMVALYGCFAACGLVLGNIVQSTRGLVSVGLGWLVARTGRTDLEERVGAGVVARRVLAALLLVAAVALYAAGARQS